jgi:hypothetical protein
MVSRTGDAHTKLTADEKESLELFRRYYLGFRMNQSPQCNRELRYALSLDYSFNFKQALAISMARTNVCAKWGFANMEGANLMALAQTRALQYNWIKEATSNPNLEWDHIQLILINPLNTSEAKRRFILNLPNELVTIPFLKDLVGMRNRGHLDVSIIARRARKLMNVKGLPDEWIIGMLG